MHSIPALMALLPLSVSAQTLLGAYVFHRHGDRTSKSTPPANLTTVGYQQVYQSGTYYRNRYVAANSAQRIRGISTDVLKASQLAVSAPADAVLFTSATGFMQGLYPPTGDGVSAQLLSNGTLIPNPLNGYQLAVISQVSSGANSENNGWLQDATGCANAVTSSNQYFYSPEYMALLNSTKSFYSNIVPVVNNTFNSSYVTYKNAYTVYDLINVAEIHNQTIPSRDVLTPDVLLQLRTLADEHEFNLAWNASSTARAISGMQLAAEATQFLNQTITKAGANKLGIQFGAYATSLSFFGLAGLADVDLPLFRGVPDYSSSMAFELYTNATVANNSFPAVSDLYVRWLWNNGSAAATDDLTAYPLFGSQSVDMPWTDFQNRMNAISIGDTASWCRFCGNTTGVCAAYSPAGANGSSAGAASSSSSSSGGNGISKAVAGVIGAMVTLGVIFLVEALVLLVFGLRLVKKNHVAPSAVNGNGVAAKA